MVYTFGSWLIYGVLFIPLLFDIFEVWEWDHVSLCWTDIRQTPAWRYYSRRMLAHLTKCPSSQLHTPLRKYSFCLDYHSLHNWNKASSSFWHDESVCVCVCVCARACASAHIWNMTLLVHVYASGLGKRPFLLLTYNPAQYKGSDCTEFCAWRQVDLPPHALINLQNCYMRCKCPHGCCHWEEDRKQRKTKENDKTGNC